MPSFFVTYDYDQNILGSWAIGSGYCNRHFLKIVSYRRWAYFNSLIYAKNLKQKKYVLQSEQNLLFRHHFFYWAKTVRKKNDYDN